MAGLFSFWQGGRISLRNPKRERGEIPLEVSPRSRFGLRLERETVIEFLNRHLIAQIISMSENKADLPRILFLCTGNSCRSQMAEGWGCELLGDRYEFYSAGIEAHGLNPNAVEVMREKSIDITGQRSQTLEEIDRELGLDQLDVVITVCGHADENCPVLPISCTKLHLPFDDPPKLAKEAKTPEEAISHYRRVRDEIRAQMAKLPELLSHSSA